MIDYGGDTDYANSRLSNCLVSLVDGSPFYLKRVMEDGYCCGTFTLSGKGADVPLDAVNTEPVLLGYVNMTDQSRYCYRLPIRHYKQGLNEVNFACRGGHAPPVYMKSVAHTVGGEYPILGVCWDYLFNEEKSSIAFCRDFSLGFSKKISNSGDLVPQVTLSYRGSLVGVVDPTDSGKTLTYRLSKGFEFLEESLLNEIS